MAPLQRSRDIGGDAIDKLRPCLGARLRGTVPFSIDFHLWSQEESQAKPLPDTLVQTRWFALLVFED